MLPYDTIGTGYISTAYIGDTKHEKSRDYIFNYDNGNNKINFRVYSVDGQYSRLPIYYYKKNNYGNLRKCLLNDNIIWKLLVDGKYHDSNNPYIFDEDRIEDGQEYEGEKGWLGNMKNGFKFMLNIYTRFNDIIKIKNEFARTKLFGDYYENLYKCILPDAKSIYANKPYNGKICYCYIGIGNHNGNYEGLLEFFIKSENSTLHKEWDRYLAPDIREEKLVKQKIKFELNQKYYDISICKNGNDIIHKLESGKIVSSNLPGDMIRAANEDIVDVLTSECKEYTIGYKFEDYQMAYKNLKKMFVHGNINFIEELDKGLLEENKYNLQPVKCNKEEKIIALIVNLCQDLDIAHFFVDGNTRMAYMFLNQMLITYGFLPTILDNPSELEVTDIKTLVRKVIKGQRNVLDLLSSNEKISTFPTILG